MTEREMHTPRDRKTSFDPTQACHKAKELAELSPKEAYKALTALSKTNPDYWVQTEAQKGDQAMQLMRGSNEDLLGLRFDQKGKNYAYGCSIVDH